PVLNEAFELSKKKNRNIHLLGLVSNGGVHSSMEHLKGLCSIAAKKEVKNLFIHAFTDGRDTDPKGGERFITELEEHLERTTGTLATVIGRYYAMDRDKRWERVKKAYDLLVHGIGVEVDSAGEAIKKSYSQGITDEFLLPLRIRTNGMTAPSIQEGDIVLFFNFRTDRGRQLTEALSQQSFPEQDMTPLDLHFITMTTYDKTYKNVNVLFKETDLRMTLGEVVSQAGLSQLRIAETEKYPHVTFFFSGGREEPWPGERRIMIQSPKVATYDQQPQMSAYGITDAVVQDIEINQPDLIVLNFANADMVGHTGVYSAVVEAVETVDTCLKQVVENCLRHDYGVVIIADHGNADYMVNADGTPNTAHTTNPVPVIIISSKGEKIKDGKLADVAPTLLRLMGLDAPKQMTGEVLIAS
ncbi:MAG: 2,3-bisphosphoglycerate-independent phosphoglycerate mutase, partial [Bacteroidota bacterium]|nr:2,3-bisphosphoglycerate-independent phosphoglycerate mutase [Bacteroidota bacterium]